HLAAAAFPAAVPAAQDDRRLRDPDSGVALRSGLSGTVHAADQERHADDPCHCDPRIVRQYGAREAIATSTGQNDSGLFELSFRDERYLPFEYLGAVSRWRIELPRDNNFFDMDALTDVVFTMNY